MKKINLLKVYYKFTLIVALLFFTSYVCEGQVYRGSIESQTQNIRFLLHQEGFQNVGAIYDYDKLIISYENRRYRLESQAIKKIVNLLYPEIPKGIQKLIIISQKLNIPILHTTVPLTDYQTFRQDTSHLGRANWNVSLQSNQDEKFSSVLISNKGNYKIELELKPELRLAIGGFPDPVVHQLNLLPILHFYLWKGGRFSVQTSLPIWNEFENSEESFWRPSIIQLEQRFRLPFQIFASFSGGYFTKKRYGGVIELGKYFCNGNILLRGKLGYTGYANYEKEPERIWKIGRLDYLDYKLGLDYYFPKWNVVASVEYAKTLFDQNMLRGSVSKYFKEVEIGFFVFNTQKGNNYGLHCSIPLFPKKYFKPGFFSIRPSTSFDYIYHGTQNYVTQYRTIQDLHTFMKRLEPFFIQRQLY